MINTLILNDTELSLLFLIILFCLSLFGSLQIYNSIIYKRRRINYNFYKARDALIHCVAINSINKDDVLFNRFYNASNDLISVTSTDFFSLSNFYRVIEKYDPKEKQEFNDTMINEIKKRSPEFQKAINTLLSAICITFIDKNIILYFLVNFNLLYVILKKILFDKIKNSKPIIKQKYYYNEYIKFKMILQQI